MTLPLLFVCGLALVLGAFYAWAFANLPRERWQFVGIIPLRKQPGGNWTGLNLTYYGLFNACSVTFAAAIVLILLAATGLSAPVIVLTVLSVLCIFAFFAKLMARIVEKKAFTFSIGGASFAGLMLTPPLLGGGNQLLAINGYDTLPIMRIMAAVAVGYAFGEGTGRLACLSFGCCYGKPLDRLPVLWRPWLSAISLVYEGPTKKAVYADKLSGRRVLAVPAVTAVLYTVIGLAGTYLFLSNHTVAAYLVCVLGTQIWRAVSEFLRADYRGGGRISAYQIMAVVAAATAVAYAFWLPPQTQHADLTAGLRILWNPAILLSCQLLWIGSFIYTGRSQVTASRVSFFVHTDRV